MTAAPQLYLILETQQDGGSATGDVLSAALNAADIASVVIKNAQDGRLAASTAKPLIELAQKKDVAALVSDDSALARIVKADGVHVSWSKAPVAKYSEARSELGERYIVGADAGRSRHDAMLLGEAGADYIAFGIPSHVEDRQTAEDRQVDLIAWWSEIFQVPCVASDVAAPRQAARLAAAGADFVTVTLAHGTRPNDAAAVVRAFAAAISMREAVD